MLKPKLSHCILYCVTAKKQKTSEMSSPSIDSYPGLRSHICIENDDNYTGTLEELIQKVDPTTVALWIWFNPNNQKTQVITKESFAHLLNLKILCFEYGDEINVVSLPSSIEVLIDDSNVYYNLDAPQSELSKKNKMSDSFVNLNLPNLRYIQTQTNCCYIPKTVKYFELVLYDPCDVLDARLLVKNDSTDSTECFITFVNSSYVTDGFVSKLFPGHNGEYNNYIV